MSEKPQPIAKVEAYWPITGAVWENRTDEGQLYFKFTIQRSFKDADGNYRNTDSFGADDAKAMQATIDACWNWIMTHGRKRAREHNQPETVATSPAITTATAPGGIEDDIPF